MIFAAAPRAKACSDPMNSMAVSAAVRQKAARRILFISRLAFLCHIAPRSTAKPEMPIGTQRA
jgi:hypothetical protein